MRVQKLFTADGRKVKTKKFFSFHFKITSLKLIVVTLLQIESLQALYHGPNLYVAAGRENFQMMEYRVKKVVITDDKKGDFKLNFAFMKGILLRGPGGCFMPVNPMLNLNVMKL